MEQIAARRLLSPLVAMLIAAGAVVGAFAADLRPSDEVVSLVDRGQFKEAEARIAHDLAKPDTPAAERDALAFERERMRRIRLDFPHTEADVRAKIKEAIPDLREDEFAAWDRSNLLERCGRPCSLVSHGTRGPTRGQELS